VEGILAPWHWAILIVVVLLIFGPRKLPELGNSLGKSIRGFKKGMSDAQDELKGALADTPAEPATGQPVMASVAEQPIATAVADPSTTVSSQPSESSSAESPSVGPPIVS
jgi:sec-independent protein translocase protein TatA